MVTPVFRNGDIIGAVAFKIDTQAIYKLTSNYEALGKTGEILLCLRTGNELTFVNPLRHDAQATFKKKVDDFPFTDADGSQLIMEMGIDITERNQVEEALKISEQQLKSLSTQLIISQETERKRVAQELHDSVGQTMSALKFAVECSLNQTGKSRGENYLKSFQDLIPRIQSAIEEVDRIGKGLHPSVLEDLGIMATVSWFCREFQSVYSGIRIKKDLAIAEDDVPEHLKVVIYRIVQEGLNNVAKHSQADLVYITLEKKNHILALTVKDNGRGFNVDTALLPEKQKRGFGLFSMMKRAEISGGSLVIASDKETGTIIRASWPCD
jgi:signal transduction histidine kinase